MNKSCICKIRKYYRAIVSFEMQLNKIAGINLNEAMLLCLLSEHDKMSAGELSAQLGLTPSNTSKVISNLEHNGLVRRMFCKEDGRSMLFRITKKGTDKLNSICCDQVQIPEGLKALAQSADDSPATATPQ
ncbi:MAG: MarR family winged helix-turn-helix transcriptional regulator [Prevotella sp.]|jgi:DNA-binding MarR family transcriptional regulator